MATSGHHHCFSPSTDLLSNRLNLGLGAVIIVFTLDSQNRYSDIRQIIFDIPMDEIRVQPYIVPSPESVVGIGAVIFSQSFAKITV